MELFSNGFERNVFDGFREYNFDYRAKEQLQYVYDKKVKVYYRVALRMKNSNRGCRNSNTESLHLEINSNLSQDFNFTYVDNKSGISLVINLLETEQREFGCTYLKVSTQYINEKQEIFENNDLFNCESIGGTITKRLQHYKESFLEQCYKLQDDVLNKGFKVHNNHIIDNLAAYIYTESKKKNNRIAIYDNSPSQQINNWLIVFSILNNDCFFKDYIKPGTTCDRFGKPWNNYGKKHYDLTPVRLPVEQVEIFEKIFSLPWPQKYAIEQAIDKFCTTQWDGGQFSYHEFKQWFLENIKF